MLRDLGDTVTLVFADLAQHDVRGMSWHDDGWAGIALCRTLGQQERAEVLLHEMVHLQRGGGRWHPDPVMRAREERHVDREVARHLVPPAELSAWLAAQEEPVTVWDVAEEWGVSERLAAIALGG